MAGPMSMELKYTQNLIKKLRSLSGGQINKDVKVKVIRAAGAQLETAVRQNISRTDHTLRSLAELDHPYARRHGFIQIHPNKPYMIHRHSGNFAGSLQVKLRTSGEPNWSIGFKYGAKRYFKYLITGTKVMLPRNVLYDTSQNEKVRSNMNKAAQGVFEKAIRKSMK